MFLTHAILGRCIATNKLWKPREATQQCSNTSTSLVPRRWLPQMSSGTCTASYPDPPSTLQEERGVWWISTTFLYLRSEFQDTIWLADFKITSIPPILGFLTTNHLALPTYLAHPLLKPSKTKPNIVWECHQILLSYSEEGLGTRLAHVLLTCKCWKVPARWVVNQ